jgi:hypothetical protein
MTGHINRRAALALFGTAPALAVLPAAAASDADAELLGLIAQWREADARANAADPRVWELDEAIEVPIPGALIKPRTITHGSELTNVWAITIVTRTPFRK